MENINNVKNLRKINVSYVGPTNRSGAKVKVFENPRYKDQKVVSKTFSFDYSFGCIEKQGYDILTRNGFDIIARCSDLKSYSFLCDNWAWDEKIEKRVEDLK